MKESDLFFRRHLAQTTPFPFDLEIERAEGVWIYDIHGKRYMDMISGVGVSALGHGHPKIKDALKDQIDKHLHVMVYGEFHQSSQQNFAALLTAQLPEALDTVYFVNSGTEAVEAALKLAKRATGRTRLTAFQGAYHGSTHGSLSVSGNMTKKMAFLPLLPDVQFIRFNHLADLEKISCRTAGFIVETIQGDAGVRIPDVEWMKALRSRCDEMGSLLILDEIQAGIGRTGTLFAFEQFGIVPDVLLLGKALGGGLPIGAMITSRKLMELLSHDPLLGHITTFGGHPLPCAAGHAALKILIEENILADVESKGRMIKERLEPHKQVKEVRQRGLFIAVDLKSAEATEHVVQYCLDKGLIGFWFLSHPDSFRLAPPLNITQEELEWAIQVIEEALDSIE